MPYSPSKYYAIAKFYSSTEYTMSTIASTGTDTDIVEVGPGSTMFGRGVMAKKLYTDGLYLGTEEANDISHDYTDGSSHKLPSSYALLSATQIFLEQLGKIDPNNNFLLDNTTITLPLVDQSFIETSDDWNIAGWTMADGYISFVAGDDYPVTNYIEIAPEVITFTGTYFLRVSVPRLDSGKIVMYDHSNTVIGEIDTFGDHPFEITVTNPDVQRIRFVAEGVFPGEVVTISSIWFHRVTPRLKEYLKFLFLHAGGVGVSPEALADAIAQSQTYMQSIIDSVTQPILDDLLYHLSNFDNPHKITPEAIDAARKDHVHAPESIGAADREHTHSPDECGAAPLDHTHTPESIGAARLEHTHTPAECGAAPENHSHIPEDIGAADRVHTHVPEDIGAADRVHTHEEYLTEDETNAVVVRVVSEVMETAGILTPKMLVPMTIAQFPSGSLPDMMEDSSISPPICPIVFPYIVHRTKGPYDYFEGVASTNVQPATGHPIEYAFKKHLTEDDTIANVAAFESSLEDLDEWVLVEYYFHTKRSISGYTFRKDTTNVVQGVPTSWFLNVDGTPVRDTGDEFLNWYSAQTVTDTFGTPVTGRRFSFVIKKVHLDSNNLWGIGIDFVFSDVEDGKIAISLQSKIAASIREGIALTTIQNVPSFDPGISEENTPLYLSMDIDTETSSATFVVSPMRAEFSEFKKGIAGLMGRFSGKTNIHWGTVQTTSEEAAHLVENLYGEDSKYFRTEDGVTSVVIRHDFVTPQKMCGHRLVFSEEILNSNYVPDGWKFEIVYSDNSRAILEEVSNYYPSRLDGTSKQPWWITTYEIAEEDVIAFELTLTASKGQPAIGLWKFIPMFDGDFYNIRTCEMFPDARFPFGKLEYVKSFDGTWEGFVHNGVTLGNGCHVPIDGFNVQSSSYTIHDVPNPFNTREIDFSLYTYAVDGYSPAAQVEQISEDSIRVVTMAPGRYSLRISRIW